MAVQELTRASTPSRIGLEEKGQRAAAGGVGDDQAQRAPAEVEGGDLGPHEGAHVRRESSTAPGAAQRRHHRGASSTRQAVLERGPPERDATAATNERVIECPPESDCRQLSRPTAGGGATEARRNGVLQAREGVTPADLDAADGGDPEGHDGRESRVVETPGPAGRRQRGGSVAAACSTRPPPPACRCGPRVGLANRRSASVRERGGVERGRERGHLERVVDHLRTKRAMVGSATARAIVSQPASSPP